MFHLRTHRLPLARHTTQGIGILFRMRIKRLHQPMPSPCSEWTEQAM